ncbi:hypothetical protein [Providencia huaxiensis]|nr:hypothetical protein [Providencia huaxiensis]
MIRRHYFLILSVQAIFFAQVICDEERFAQSFLFTFMVVGD